MPTHSQYGCAVDWGKRSQCLRAVHDAGLLVFDLSSRNFVWDVAARRMLMINLNSCIRGRSGRRIEYHEKYSAPEILEKPYIGDAKSDVYSLGLLFMEMAVSRFCG